MANNDVRFIQCTQDKLPQEFSPGTIYFTTDTQKIYFDYIDGDRCEISVNQLVYSQGNEIKILKAENVANRPWLDSDNNLNFSPKEGIK